MAKATVKFGEWIIESGSPNTLFSVERRDCYAGDELLFCIRKGAGETRRAVMQHARGRLLYYLDALNAHFAKPSRKAGAAGTGGKAKR